MMSDTGMLCLVLGSLLAGSGLPAENVAVATQAETADQYLIDGRVLDADSGEPIEDFRVLPGTPFRQVRTAHDPSPAVWQPHLIRICKKGRLQGLENYRGITLRIAPNAPHFGFSGDNELWKGFAALRASSVGPLVFRDQLPVQANGTFRIPDVIPAWYQLFVHAADGQLIGSSRFQVHGYEHPGADQHQDIGSVRLRN